MARVRTETACWYGDKFYPADSVFEREPDPPPNPPWPPYLEVLPDDDRTPLTAPRPPVSGPSSEGLFKEPWVPPQSKKQVEKAEDFIKKPSSKRKKVAKKVK